MTFDVDVLPHGTRLEHHRGRVLRGTDQEGHEIFRLHWDDGVLVQVSLFRPDRTQVLLRKSDTLHPLFGAVDLVVDPTGPHVLGKAAAVDWSAPRAIPPLDDPGALPPGTGTAILNLLALQASRAGRASLRYVGPYPTAALFRTLLQSFRVRDPFAAEALFTGDVERIAVSGRMTEIPVDFEPAPHAWRWSGPGVCLQLRDGVERVYLDGRPFDAFGDSPRRLRTVDEDLVLTMDIAGEPWAEIAILDAEGRLKSRNETLPELPAGLDGAELPAEIVAVLAEVLENDAPVLLRPAIAEVLRAHAVVWAPTGLDVARFARDRFEIHTALALRLPERAPEEMLRLLVHALGPIVRHIAQDRLRAADRPARAVPNDGLPPPGE